VDPLQGRKSELVRLEGHSAGSPAWDLSPNGSTAAIVDLDENQDSIRVVQLSNGSSRSIAVGGSKHLSGISWSADGNGLFVASSSVHAATILRVNVNGEVSELWTTSSSLGVPLASPDGRNLAFTISTFNSNAWVVENF
jgi:Tol biopolymer transport system component